jgi:hypothetical protein
MGEVHSISQHLVIIIIIIIVVVVVVVVITVSYPMSTRGFFLRAKRSGREADHSPPSSAEVNNAWSYTSTDPDALMAWYLVKHSDNFTIIIIIIMLFHNFERKHIVVGEYLKRQTQHVTTVNSPL